MQGTRLAGGPRNELCARGRANVKKCGDSVVTLGKGCTPFCGLFTRPSDTGFSRAALRQPASQRSAGRRKRPATARGTLEAARASPIKAVTRTFAHGARAPVRSWEHRNRRAAGSPRGGVEESKHQPEHPDDTPRRRSARRPAPPCRTSSASSWETAPSARRVY